jgi:hypothetical protein
VAVCALEPESDGEAEITFGITRSGEGAEEARPEQEQDSGDGAHQGVHGALAASQQLGSRIPGYAGRVLHFVLID